MADRNPTKRTSRKTKAKPKSDSKKSTLQPAKTESKAVTGLHTNGSATKKIQGAIKKKNASKLASNKKKNKGKKV